MESQKLEKYRKKMAFKSKFKKNPIIFRLIRDVKYIIYVPVMTEIFIITRRLRMFLCNCGIINLDENTIKLRELKETHIGETCFIIGNGPSLTAEDLNILYENEVYCFGSNRINVIFDETKWRPSCYVAVDRNIALINRTTFDEVFKENINLYIFSKALYDCLKEMGKLPNSAVFAFRKPENYKFKETRFSDNPELFLIGGYTVTNIAIQMAVYMGFKRICLLGVDCTYANQLNKNGTVQHYDNIKTYFKTKNQNEENNVAFTEGMLQAYINAENYCLKNGIEFLNCSRGNKIKVLPFAKVEDVIRMINK